MELTPQRLREVEFKERWRGYDPEEVDDLLERVADQVFLLTPTNVEVSPEEKRRLQERGLYGT